MRYSRFRSALPPPLRRREAGFTLIEMLVVVTIVLAITGLAIAVAVPDVTKRRLREAARQINGFCQGAKARAAASGRQVGVRLVPFEGDPRATYALEYVEVPPPYGGDTINSWAMIGFDSSHGHYHVTLSPGDIAWRGATPALDLIRPGDLIQFNYQGHYFRLGAAEDRDANEFALGGASTSAGVLLPLGVRMPYKIIRQPVKMAAPPLELPETVVVDLPYSGTDTFNWGSGVPVILFGPGGSVAGYSNNGGNITPATGPIYLLVGKRENVGSNQNLADFQTIWVAINNQTGLVTSVDNAGGGTLASAREFARKAQTLGGR